MRIATVFFEYPDYPHQYRELLDVFEYSCKKIMPNIPFDVIKIQIPLAGTYRHIGEFANTIKLREWVKYIRNINDNVLLVDADMLCLSSAQNAFTGDYDIGYTIRTGPGPALNGGVVMVRNTPEAKDWVEKLLIVNEQMYNEPNFHHMWAKKYPGMNQSAMGFMIEAGCHKAKLREFRTREWNAVECDWSKILDWTKFVHIKGNLRDIILNDKPSGQLANIKERWYSISNEKNNLLDDGERRKYFYPEINTVYI